MRTGVVGGLVAAEQIAGTPHAAAGHSNPGGRVFTAQASAGIAVALQDCHALLSSPAMRLSRSRLPKRSW
ncbi:hypothetical protein GCM10007880_65190 [Mesorhizobium amorphae]|nr:hypothetical protein GCM10007880_65190 [Mesorhizobium amorphae]